MNDRKWIMVAGLATALAVVLAVIFSGSSGGSAENQGAANTAEGHHSEKEGLVEMTKEQQRASEIGIFDVTAGSLDAEIIAQGSVASSPQGQAILSAGAEGRITSIKKRLGDPIRRGETVATIESREAAAISSELISAESRAALARSQLNREQRLYDEKITARADLETARAENQQAAAEARRASQAAAASGVSGRFIAVRSPIDGRITSSPAILGSYVNPQDELFRIANPNLIQIEAAVPAQDARNIATGAAATVETSEGEISARVLAVTPAADPENRAAIVVLAPASGTALVPGEYLRVRIRQQTASNQPAALIVPAEAVQSVEGRSVVFVKTISGFRARSVTTGAKSGGRIEIVGGLEAGEQIAGKNAFLLKSELGRGEAEH